MTVHSIARTMLPMVLAVLIGASSASALLSQSVADLARQERARKAKAGKVYTNDEISPLPPPTSAPAPAAESEKPAVAQGEEKSEEKKTEGGAEGTAKAEGAAPAAKTPAAAKEPAKPPEKSQAELEKEYRDRFAKLRDNLKTQEDKLDVMQREFNLMQTQFYSDPNVALREQRSRSQINERTQAIDQQKAAVEKAKQDIADLEEELRKKGLPAGWAR